MNEHEIEQRLRSWARSSGAGAGPAELRERILEIPATDRRADRRHRLRLLPGPTPTAGADGHGEPAQPIPTIQRNGGTRSMFSATKLFALAASVALFGALTLALPLGQQQDPVTPGAEAPTFGEITPFTGEMELLGQDRVGSVDGFSTTGEQWTTKLTTTDPRYSGLTTGFHSLHQNGRDGGFVRVHTSRVFSEDADGTWLATGRGYQDPDTKTVTWTTNATGEGAYEGLSTMSICEQEDSSTTMACRGIIFEGAWPQFPDDAPDEIPAPYLWSQ